MCWHLQTATTISILKPIQLCNHNQERWLPAWGCNLTKLVWFMADSPFILVLPGVFHVRYIQYFRKYIWTFWLPMVGGNICRSNTSVSQSLAGRNRKGGGKMPTLMIIKPGLRLWWMRNGYVKKDQQVNCVSLSSILLSMFFCICHNFVPDSSQRNTVNKLLCFFNCVTGWKFCMISGFCHEVNKNCTLLGYYVVSSGNSWLTFQDNLMAPSSWVKNRVLGFLTLE